jgi:hypothetical protein
MGIKTHMNYFQALEYFTNWGLVLAIVMVTIVALASSLLVTIWCSLVYRLQQETLVSRLRKRLIATLNHYPPPGLDALLAEARRL